MSDTTSRALRLLSLLQRRRYWPGAELADRLGVSDRTLRRDIERLRELGYTVDSDRGVDGGYRLGGTTGDAVLLLDDDEAIALAVALHGAARGTSELAEASLGALGKVLSMLGPDQRRRAEAVRGAVAVGSWSERQDEAPHLGTLDVVAAACRDRVRLSFEYVAADGSGSKRYVEPLQLVALSSRWYLVAYDLDRSDWRTFRVDRMAEPTPARNSFPPRPAPAPDLSEYVRRRLRDLHVTLRVVVEVEAPGDDVREAFGTWVEVTDLGGARCRMEMDADSFVWPTHVVANLGAPFRVLAPEAFRVHLEAIAQHLGGAVAEGQPARARA